MKIVSLELAKQLKEAGYPQEGTMWYVSAPKTDGVKQFYLPEYDHSLTNDYISDYAYRNDFLSPTADEILDQLPVGTLSTRLPQGGYAVAYKKHGGGMTGDSLADAAAKMWLYLKKEGLL